VLQSRGNDGIRRRTVHLLTRRVTLCHVKSEKDAPPDDRFRKEGRWFVAEGFWLLPKIESVIANADAARARFTPPRLRSRKGRDITLGKRSREISRKQAEAITRRLKRDFEEIVDASNAYYRAQPHWSLHDITVKSVVEAIELLQEFVDFTEHITPHFRWMTGPLTNEKELKKHGWKHITYDWIKGLTEGKMSFLVPPAMRADLVGTSEQLQDLIRQAENRVPQAIARLEFLFPRRQDLVEACEFTLLKKIPRETLDGIYSVAQLAGEWATMAVCNPDSEEATRALGLLRLLVLKGSALRSSSDKGRPKLQVHPVAIREIYKMSSCLIRQVQEVRTFLDRTFPRGNENQSRLLRLYPWLNDVAGRDIVSFIKGSASTGAMQITGRALRISPGKVQQTLYED
jgi:hypothetical protein